MIEGVKIKEIEEISNEQGGIQHMVRCDEPDLFAGFGEVYFSFVHPQVTKGWHRHIQQTSVLSCVRGEVQLALVLGDDMMDVRFGDGQRKVVRIPPGVLYGWKNIGEETAILANCASHPHDPSKSEKLDLAAVNFAWQLGGS